MKRLWLVIFLGLIIFVSIASEGVVLSFSGLIDIGQFRYSVATYQDLGLENFVQINDLKIYKFSNGITCNIDLNDCIAEMIEMDKEDFEKLDCFMYLPCVMTEEVEGIIFKYLYDKSLPKILKVGNVEFNLQVAFIKDDVKIGYPCIVDSI